jgi:hypothetical protein
MPPLGTDGVGGDPPKGTIAMDDASTDEPRSVPSKTPSAKASPARDSDGATVPLKDTIADGGDPASPIESAALRSRVIQLEAELAEAMTMAENPSSVELAAARSRSISLEAELESARADARKSEEAMGGMLRMQRAMSSAQKAKITQLQEQNAQLEARIVELNASLAEARTTADAERQSREELRREAEKFEAHVNDAIESREAQWGAANAHAVNEVRSELKAAKELTRKMHVAHAAAKLRWAAERAHIIHSVHSVHTAGEDAGVDSAHSLGALAAARARSDVAGSIPPSGGGHHDPRALAAEVAASSAPGTALHALLAATTRFSTDARRTGQPSDETAGGETAGDDSAHDDPLRELLRDAMEEEVAAAIERGYHRDGDTIVVGANEIVEAIVAKYSERGDDGDGARGGGDGSQGGGDGESAPSGTTRDSGGERRDESRRNVDDVNSDDEERGAWRAERASLVAELARARAAADAADTRAALLTANGANGLANGGDDSQNVDDLAAAYEAEEAKAVAALEIAAELRANALEAELEALRRRAVSPAQLRAVLEELRTLRAKTEALKQGCVMTQRLVRPTVESAIACLRLDAAEGARQGSLADGADGGRGRGGGGGGGGGTDGGGNTTTPGFEPRTSTTPGARIGFVSPRTAANGLNDGTPRTPSVGQIGGYPRASSSSAAANTAVTAVTAEDLPETFRVAMDGLGFSKSLRKSAAVLVAEAEADAARRALASAAKKALASIMDSPAGRNRRAG